MIDIEILKKHEFIVIGFEHYNPLGVIRSLGENGIRPNDCNMSCACERVYKRKK